MILQVTEVKVKMGQFKEANACSKRLMDYIQERHPGYVLQWSDYVDSSEFNKVFHVETYESLAKMEELSDKLHGDEECSTLLQALLQNFHEQSIHTRYLHKV